MAYVDFSDPPETETCALYMEPPGNNKSCQSVLFKEDGLEKSESGMFPNMQLPIIMWTL